MPPRTAALIPLALACAGLLAACTPSAPTGDASVDATATPPATDTAAAPADAPTLPASDPLAGADIVVDLREPDRADTVVLGEALEGVLEKGGPQADISSQREGRFTADRAQHAALLLPDGARAIAPTETPAELLILEGEKVVKRFPLDAPYLRIAAVTDVDGDGLDDVLLRADGMQMGERFASIHAFALAGGRPKPLARFDQAYSDDCGSPRAAGEVRAAVIVRERGKLAEKLFWAECVPGGNPMPGQFQAVGAPGTAPVR